MKFPAPLRLRPLVIAIAASLLGGCAAWPGSELPTVPELSKEAAKSMPVDDGCAQSTAEAVRCARYLSSVLANVESDTGNWDTWYGLGSVAAGTLAAIYLKSDTDRTQALEDLAVTVAALAGIRGVLKPDERRRVAREGRAAVDCMIAAAEGIKTYADEAKAADDDKQKEKAEIAASAASARLEEAKQELSTRTQEWQRLNPENKNNKANFTAAKQNVASAQRGKDAAEAELKAAQAAVSANPAGPAATEDANAKLAKAEQDLQRLMQEQQRLDPESEENKASFKVANDRLNSAKNDLAAASLDVQAAQTGIAEAAVQAANRPIPKLNATLDREFGISETLRNQAANQLKPGAKPAQPTDVNRFATGVLLQRQLLDLQSTQQKANKSAEVAEALLPKTLTHGVYEVLNHVRGSIADLAAASENLAKTQRDTVNGLIADLKAKTDAEAEAATKLEGASAATPATEPPRPAEAQDAADTAKTPAKRKIVAVFNQCVAPAT